MRGSTKEKKTHILKFFPLENLWNFTEFLKEAFVCGVTISKLLKYLTKNAQLWSKDQNLTSIADMRALYNCEFRVGFGSSMCFISEAGVPSSYSSDVLDIKF